jgi:hypothetical protein
MPSLGLAPRGSLLIRAFFYGARSSLQFAFERIVDTRADRWWRSGGDMSFYLLEIEKQVISTSLLYTGA